MSLKAIRSVTVEIAHDVNETVFHDKLQSDIMETLIEKGFHILSSEVTGIRERMLPDDKK